MAILFDLDGTLLDTAPDFIPAIDVLRKEKGLAPIDLSLVRPAVSNGVAGLMQTCFGLQSQDPEYDSLAARLLSLYKASMANHQTLPFPGMMELLTALEHRQIPWGIVTNRPSWSTIPLLDLLNLKSRAACVVSGDTTPNPKPHPDPLFFACRQIDVSPKLCIYIGDAERDIQAGKAAGMTTIATLFGYIENPASALQWGADHYVQHADEILPWILAWQPPH